jgi:hypothetical protein
MITLRQDASDDAAFGRIVAEDGVRPIRDTGFRMEPQPAFEYIRPDRVLSNLYFDDFMHNDDVIDDGPATIRGQVLDAVRSVVINREQAQARERSLTLESIERSERNKLAS